MPRNVRPSYVNVFIDGEQKVSTGPRSRAGNMTVNVYVRSKGNVMCAVTVEAIASRNKDTVTLRVGDLIGTTYYEYIIEQ